MHPKRWFPLIVLLLLVSACVPVETEPPEPGIGDPNATAVPSGSEMPPWNTYGPAKGDESKTRGNVLIDSQEILILESFPPQYVLQVQGALPTPCHELRVVVDAPTADSRINVQFYSVVDPDMACTQVLEPFDVAIPLGSFVRGTYTVFLNEQEVGEITP